MKLYKLAGLSVFFGMSTSLIFFHTNFNVSRLTLSSSFFHAKSHHLPCACSVHMAPSKALFLLHSLISLLSVGCLHVGASKLDFHSNWTLQGYNDGTTGNPIDDCRRQVADWSNNRMHLADCGIGFGSNALGGKDGAYYVVTDPSDDPLHPAPGTLRYGVIQQEPLWITFQGDMTINLEKELVVNSHKTIDGRGAEVHIANGPCITLFHVSHVIIHGLHVHHCKVSEGGWVMTKPEHLSHRGQADGDGIRVFESHDVWIDHNAFSDCHDGLVDVLHGSNAVSISNNHFHDHDKVMLLGHADDSQLDYDMKVTVAYNRFGPRCVQRMPRFGYFHVVNNDYHAWEMYAIGGSSRPTILSQGNRFLASNNINTKEITKRVGHAGDWKSVDDLFLNGAYFVESGQGDTNPSYTTTQKFTVGLASDVTKITAEAGALTCQSNRPC